MTLPAPPAPAADWALFLDLDGTLAPLRPHPDEVLVDAATRQAVAAMAARLAGALCVVSGRPVHELRRLLPGLDGVALVGCHGAEGLDPPPDAASRTDTAAARAALAPVAARFEGVWIEDKPSGFAIHYRRFPHAGAALHRAALDALSGVDSLRVIAGHAVIEILPATVSKGRVVEHLLARPPFAARRPVAVGDDATDEDAFVAATARGGFGVAVGPRASAAARFGLDDTGAVGRWLRTSAASAPPPATAR